MSNANHSINYVEFPLKNNAETKRFYSEVFGWEFQDFGPNYIAFSGAGVDGGFNGVDDVPANPPGVLVVLYAKDLEKTAKAISDAGGTIHKPAYSFPGGRRFHFLDPNGTELAVWSET